MDDKFKQINDLITQIASGNPNINTDQIRRARVMYTGDTRPIEEIEAELLAYLKEIEPPKREELSVIEETPQDKNPEIIDYTMPDGQEAFVEIHTDSSETPIYIHGMYHEMENPEKEIIEPETVSEELDSMFENEEKFSLNEAFTELKAPQFVKTPVTPPTTEDNGNGGYGNVISILISTIMLSIMAIIISVVTIIAN